ncbi:MAG: STAS domain-containing protein [Chitinophagaceae bacterium]|nr:STAS domain-containing protein [Chitinophagaceae bacterium]MCW5925438.1 STAS domain-containing protein [Chitinophagaceae bacterium]
MDLKLDTKEKFHVITINEPKLHANMTEEIRNRLVEVTKNAVKHIILNFRNVSEIDTGIGEWLVGEQEAAAVENRSFVICELQKPVKDSLVQWEILDVLNVTPTESEAWDIIQMEEVERELLGN